jgi:Tfp pilus assembly protein PilF
MPFTLKERESRGVILSMKSFARCAVSLLLATALFSCATTPKGPSDEEKAALLADASFGALLEHDSVGALELLLKAEKLDPSLARIYHYRSLAFVQKHDLATALASERKALGLGPDVPEFNNNLGKLLIDSGKLAEAEPYLKKAAINPLYRDAFKAYTNLGILNYREGRWSAAENAFQSAITQNPTGACIAYYYRGHLALRRADFQGAIHDYDHATQNFCANFGEAHLALGVAYERSHQLDKARKKFLEVKETFPNTAFAEQAMRELKDLH